MQKNWLLRAFALLDNSLNPIPHELNEIDWKEDISVNTDKLTQHLSAFSNNPGGGFIVFGIEDKTASLKGIDQKTAENIIQKLSSVGRDSLNPPVAIDHSIELYSDIPLLFIHIKESAIKPVHFKHKTLEDTFIRSGGTTRKASRNDVGSLMLNSKTPNYEELNASTLKSFEQVLELLDYKKIFALLNKPLPKTSNDVVSFLSDEKMINNIDGAGFYISNLGAISAAHNLHDFDSLSRKAVRLIEYKGNNKIEAEREYPGSKGYAIAFEGLIDFVKRLLPGSEVIKTALRAETTIYPEIALREIIANALIHQDFTIKGAGPMIEIFDDRIEITNPGKLLPDKKLDRLIRTTPQSRNELLASSFRRFNICEERGSGFEKAVSAIELYGLPPLKFQEIDNSFKVTMYKPKSFAELTPAERIEACYQHSIIKYYSTGGMTNTSLRERFKMSDKQRSQVSLVIREALDLKKIKFRDPDNNAPKFAEYIPWWG